MSNYIQNLLTFSKYSINLIKTIFISIISSLITYIIIFSPFILFYNSIFILSLLSFTFLFFYFFYKFNCHQQKILAFNLLVDNLRTANPNDLNKFHLINKFKITVNFLERKFGYISPVNFMMLSQMIYMILQENQVKKNIANDFIFFAEKTKFSFPQNGIPTEINNSFTETFDIYMELIHYGLEQGIIDKKWFININKKGNKETPDKLNKVILTNNKFINKLSIQENRKHNKSNA